MKNFILIFLLLSAFSGAQVVQLIDSNTKENVNFERVSSLPAGAVVDGIIYAKKSGNLYKRIYSDGIKANWYGLKGDSKYNTDGDIDRLQYKNDQKIIQTKIFNTLEKSEVLEIPKGFYFSTGSAVVSKSYSKIKGAGVGSTILHYGDPANENPVLAFRGNSLLTNNGLFDLTFKTDNGSIRHNGVLLDYTEYYDLKNLNFEGFGRSALYGTIWEANFDNLKFYASGATQRFTGSVPTDGVLKFSGGDHVLKDASNNTLINKLTFSSCFGTLINLSSNKNTTVNISINGLYAETYYGDAGPVDELPMIFLNNAKTSSLSQGFMTVNSSGVSRSAYALDLYNNADFSVRDFVFTLNPSSGYMTRSVKRLNGFVKVSANSLLNLDNVIFSDPSDSVGQGVTTSLIEGTGFLNINNIKFEIRAKSSGGLRSIEKLISPTLRTNGTAYVYFYDVNGRIDDYLQLNFVNGVMSVKGKNVRATYNLDAGTNFAQF